MDGEKGKRFGFVSAYIYEQLIGGIFANEGERSGTQYNENKLPIKTDAFYSFEHLAFVIFTDTSQILLQHRNIYGYKDLGLPEMRANFLLALGTYLSLINVYVPKRVVKIEPAGERYTQEEMYSYFRETQVIGLEVSNLSIENIPQKDKISYKLYNPREEWNEITWQAVADTLKVGTDFVSLKAPEENKSSNLSKAPIARAFAASGEIQEIVSKDKNGKLRIRKKVADEEITIENIPAEPEISIPILQTILDRMDNNRRIEEWENRNKKRRKDRGPLFEDNN